MLDLIAIFKCGVAMLGIALMSGCAEIHPSWLGFFVGTQVVSPYKSAPTEESVSIYGTAIIGLGERNSLQLQVSEPVTALDTPVLRVAVDRRMF